MLVVYTMRAMVAELRSVGPLELGEERSEWVMLEPHDIMFHPPWDNGD